MHFVEAPMHAFDAERMVAAREHRSGLVLQVAQGTGLDVADREVAAKHDVAGVAAAVVGASQPFWHSAHVANHLVGAGHQRTRAGAHPLILAELHLSVRKETKSEAFGIRRHGGSFFIGLKPTVLRPLTPQ